MIWISSFGFGSLICFEVVVGCVVCYFCNLVYVIIWSNWWEKWFVFVLDIFFSVICKDGSEDVDVFNNLYRSIIVCIVWCFIKSS